MQESKADEPLALEKRLQVDALTFSYFDMQGEADWGKAPKASTPALLHRLSFTLYAQTCSALLGPSGCGKSTVLKIIAGLERPHSGSLWWWQDGQAHDLSTLAAHQRGFAMVFQDYALFPHLNVYDNIAFAPRMQKCSQEETAHRAQHWMKQMQIETLARRSVHDLSGGQKQRVALARALAAAPRLLLLDEPFSQLDQALRRDMYAMLQSILAATQIPTLLVTHDEKEAQILAHHILHFSSLNAQR